MKTLPLKLNHVHYDGILSGVCGPVLVGSRKRNGRGSRGSLRGEVGAVAFESRCRDGSKVTSMCCSAVYGVRIVCDVL